MGMDAENVIDQIAPAPLEGHAQRVLVAVDVDAGKMEVEGRYRVVVAEREVVGKVFVAVQVRAEGHQIDHTLNLAGRRGGFERDARVEKGEFAVFALVEEIAQQAPVPAEGGEGHGVL